MLVLTKIDQVIKVVLSKLAKKDIKRLPSAKVKARLMQEAQFLVQIKIAEAMLKWNSVTQEIVCMVMELRNITVIFKISKLQQEVAGHYRLHFRKL